jgi:hypothetical protein
MTNTIDGKGVDRSHRMSRDAELRDVLRLLGKCPQGRWRATPSHSELGERFQNIDVMDGDTIAATVGYLALPNAEHFGPAIAAAINFLHKHGEALATGRDEDGARVACHRMTKPGRTPSDWVDGYPDDEAGKYALRNGWSFEYAYFDAARQAQHDAQGVG